MSSSRPESAPRRRASGSIETPLEGNPNGSCCTCHELAGSSLPRARPPHYAPGRGQRSTARKCYLRRCGTWRPSSAGLPLAPHRSDDAGEAVGWQPYPAHEGDAEPGVDRAAVQYRLRLAWSCVNPCAEPKVDRSVYVRQRLRWIQAISLRGSRASVPICTSGFELRHVPRLVAWRDVIRGDAARGALRANLPRRRDLLLGTGAVGAPRRPR